MAMSILPIRLAARRLAGGVAFSFLAGCAGDGLLLPHDGTPVVFRAVSGDRQTAPAGDPLDDPLVVEALDGSGRPVSGAVVIFEFVDPAAGAELTPATTETDGAGRASVEVTLGTPVGDQDVEARLDGSAADLRVQFDLTALQPGRGGGGGGGGGDGDGGDDGGNGNGKGKGGGHGGGGDD